jgi:hypothetical protein
MRGSIRFGNPFKALFGTTRREQYVERYVLREYGRGRRLAEILEDPYVRAWSTPEERALAPLMARRAHRLRRRPATVGAMT